MPPRGVLVQQKSRNSGSKMDTWALNGQTVLVKCKISGPTCSLWRSGISYLSTEGLFFLCGYKLFHQNTEVTFLLCGTQKAEPYISTTGKNSGEYVVSHSLKYFWHRNSQRRTVYPIRFLFSGTLIYLATLQYCVHLIKNQKVQILKILSLHCHKPTFFERSLVYSHPFV